MLSGRFSRLIPPPGVDDAWHAASRAGGLYATAVHDALALTACGDFKPFTVVMEGTLEQVLGEQGLISSRAARRALTGAVQAPPCSSRRQGWAAPRAASTEASGPADQWQRSRNLVPVAVIGPGQVG